MKLNRDQRKKASDVLEKLGIAVFIASIGDALVGHPGKQRLIMDMIGIIIGFVLLILSIFILRGEKNE